MFCEKCGAFIEDGAKFCVNCGAAAASVGFNPPQTVANETDARPAEPFRETGNYGSGEQSGSYNEPFRITDTQRYQGKANSYNSNDNDSSVSYMNPTFGEAIRSFFIRYIDFAGRSSRAEYWYVFLLNLIISFGVNFLTKQISGYFGILSAIYSFATLIPMFAIDFRRLHDTGRSGWYLLLWLLPIVGWIILLIYHCQPSEGPNIYGPEPKRK